MSQQKRNKKAELLSELIEEAWGAGGSVYGGAQGGSPGKFSYTQTAGAKTWSPGSPPFRGMTGSPGGLNTKDLGEESEEFAKQAGKNYPFPIDLIFDHLVDAYISLDNAKAQLNTASKYNKVLTNEKEKKVLLDHQIEKIEQIRMMIQNISRDIDRLTLS